MKKEGTVIMTVSEYEELRYQANKCFFLEQAGVDNWEGYSDAMQALNKLIEEEVSE